MKKITFLFICVMLIAQLFAQTTDTLSIVASPELLPKNNPYLTTIKRMDGSTEKGWLANIKETELILYPASRAEIKSWRKPDFKFKKRFSLSAEQIDILTLQKKTQR